MFPGLSRGKLSRLVQMVVTVHPLVGGGEAGAKVEAVMKREVEVKTVGAAGIDLGLGIGQCVARFVCW